MEITVDRKFNRTFFSPDGNQSKKVNIKLNADEICNDYNITLHSTLTEVYEPLEIEMKIEILNNIPKKGNEFCNNCVIFDPAETATVRNKVAFITGCNGAKCHSDLILNATLINVTNPYVIEPTNEIAIEYEISNIGENAYLTQLMISIPTNVTQFKTIPSNCKLSEMISLMTCSILDGKPIISKEKTKLLIKFDMSRIQGSTLRVNASVTCAGIMTNQENNSFENIIQLSENSDILVTSKRSDSDISIDDGLDLKEIIYNYTIINNGPSNVEEMTIIISVPTKFILEPNKTLTIVDLKEDSISCQYDNNELKVQIIDHVTDLTKTYYTGDIADQSVSILSEKKTIYFNCSNTANTFCEDVQIDIQNFKSNSDKTIEIKMNLSVNLENIGKYLQNNLLYFNT